MKNLTTIVIAAVVGIVAAYVTVQSSLPEDFKPAEKKESVYERVMRTGTVRCGYTPWPPFFDQDPNTGEISGFNKEVVDAIEEMLDLKFEYIEITMGQVPQDLKSGKIDVMCGDGPWVISTIKHVDYSKPYFYAPVYLYGRANEERFEKMEDLNQEGVQFVGIDGDISSDLQIRYFPKATIQTLPSISDASQMLMNVATGKADVVIVDPQGAEVFMENNPGKLKRLFNKPVAVYGGGFSVKKGEQELLNTLNEAVNAALNTGHVDMVLKKHDPDGRLFLPVDEAYDDVR